MTRSRIGACLAALGAGFFALPQPAAAQPDPFFKGKTISMYIGFASGGSYDFYARTVARFIGRHIPGNPAVVPQAMLGAGSLQLANYLYSNAPRDGTALGIVTQTVAIEDALHSPGVRYKAAEFTAIGRATAILEVAVAGPSAKAKTVEEVKRIEMPVAGTGTGSPSEGYPRLLNELAGTKFKVISGYTSSPQGLLAVERGEVDGSFTSWNTLKRTKQDWLRSRFITVLYQCALERHVDLPDTPTDVELGLTPEGRQILTFYTSSAAVGRSILAPPGIPPERVKVLRAAFDATVKDPEFLAELEKAKQEFQPASGEELQKLIESTANVPAHIVERAEAILRAK